MKTAFEILSHHHDFVNKKGEKPSEYEEDKILLAMEEYAAQFKQTDVNPPVMNQILKQCDGKINQHGWCDKCYQPAHTTSNQCNRYLPLEQLQQPVVMQGLPTEEELWARLQELPYTKHFDDGQY